MSLTALWLPIILSAVFVFIVSSIIHMALPIHKGDCKKMKGEDGVLDAMRAGGVEPGMYMFPGATSMKDMCTPEMTAKMQRGPVGFMTVVPPGGFNMNVSLVQWFGLSLLVSALAGYVGWHALGAGAASMKVFQVTGTAGILAYAMGPFQDSIWKGAPWGSTFKFIFDGVVYGLVTGAAFAWLWPAAS